MGWKAQDKVNESLQNHQQAEGGGGGGGGEGE